MTPTDINLSVSIGGGLTLKNPVLTASGTFGYGLEFAPLVRLSRLGGIVVKGLSQAPSHGNPPPRIWETAGGMLNAIGLENVGVEAFATEKLPLLAKHEVPVIANIYGRTVEEYEAVAERLDREAGVAGLEVNISCPNVKAGGVVFGTDPAAAASVVGAVRKKTAKPVIAKLTPNVTRVADIALSVQDAGADAVSLINTLTAMAVDVKTRRPRLANVTGGLSGPAIKPVGLRMVWETARAVSVPVIGMGGIMTAEDALEYLLVGAAAIQVGTANFVTPDAAEKVLDGITGFFRKEGIADVKDFIGSLKT